MLREIIDHVPVGKGESIRQHLLNVRDRSEEDQEWEIERTAREILAHTK